MDKLYYKSICEYLLAQKQECGYNFNVFLNEDKLKQKISKGDWSPLPCIIIGGKYEYRTDDLQNYCVNFSRELPAVLSPTFTVLTDNISDVVEIEKAVTQLLNNKVTLQTEQAYQNGVGVSFDISVDDSVKIVRSKTDFTYQENKRTLYQTLIKLKSATDVVIFMREFHPAEIDFDKDVQIQLVKRGKALEELKTRIDTFSIPHQQQINTAYNQMVSLLGLETLADFSFSDIFEIMEELECDISTAVTECKERVIENKQKVEKERQRIEKEQREAEQRKIAAETRRMNINTILGRSGDSSTDMFANAIVEDFKKVMQLPYSVNIYGGSTLLEWYRLKELNEQTYPTIIIKDTIKFVMGRKTYKAKDNLGNIFDIPFSKDMLPINYGFEIEIYAENTQQIEEISNCIKNNYSNEKAVTVKLPIDDKDIYFSVGICFSGDKKQTTSVKTPFGYMGGFSTTNTQPKNVNGIYKSVLEFCNYQSVYFVKDYTKNDLLNKHRLQINLLRLAVFYGECCLKLKEIAKKVNTEYRNTFNGQTPFFNFLNSEDYKSLKYNYNNGIPVDRSVFERVFKEIIDFYPYLYDKHMQKWTTDQIVEDINNYSNLFDNKFIELYTLLGVPTQFERTSKEVPYSFVNLRTYANAMQNNPLLTLAEAIQDKEQTILEWKDSEFETVETQEPSCQGGYGNYSSAGGGFLSSMLKQGIEKTNIKRNSGKIGKRDLIGQSGCAKTYGGNCENCSIRFSCSRYFM